MYIDSKIKERIDITLKNKYGISLSEFEKLDEVSRKAVLENINAMLEENTKKNLEDINIIDLIEEEKRGAK